MKIIKKEERKCYFCGENGARTEAGLNKVEYKMIHPNLDLFNSVLCHVFGYKPWVYCCKDCLEYMLHVWESFELEKVI